MPPSTYHYRPVHAFCEKLLDGLSAVLPAGPGLPVREPPRRVLVLKFGGMGEAVLARSLIEHLRRRNPSMTVDFLVEHRTAETMACGSDSLARLYEPRTDGIARALATLREVRAERYDAAIDFEQTSVLTAAFMRLARIPIRVGLMPPKSSPRAHFLTHPVELKEGELMWSAFVRLGRTLDPELAHDVGTAALPYSSETSRWAAEWWSENVDSRPASRVVAIHLGVGPRAQYRRWPVPRFVELAGRLGDHARTLRVVLTGDTAERSLCEEFARRFGGSVVFALDVGGIERTAALLERCDLLVSADTGIMHLAAAMGTPTVGLFGPNTPACWAPMGLRATYVCATRQPCSPCINSYVRHLPARCVASVESACMWDISVDHVLGAARRVIREPWLGAADRAAVAT